jgi:hypothetical protein
MAESPEHQFLSESFLQVLDRFSALDLYGYREAERRRFDFAATIDRDWSRPLAGQTLWSHSRGLDKDIRILLSDQESEIKAFVARDNIRNRSRFAEAVQDFKAAGLGDDLFKLRPIWVPDRFDADDAEQRKTMRSVLEEEIVQDILFNVVFGRLTARDVELFLSSTGRIGLCLAVLVFTAEHTIGNIALPSTALGSSGSPIRERLLILHGAGFIAGPTGKPGYSVINSVTQKGRVFLDLLTQLKKELSQAALSPELSFVLEKVGCSPVRPQAGIGVPIGEEPNFLRLCQQMSAAESEFDIDLAEIRFSGFEGSN